MKINVRQKKENKNEDERIICKVCGKKFKHLGSHLWHGHRILAKDYKEAYGLPHNFALISLSVHTKKSERFNEHREEYLKNFEKGGIKHRFVKGQKGAKNVYRSQMAIKMQLENIKKMNNKGWRNCPVCNIQYKHLESHLYNKHKLITVEK
jgi:transcription elongation factor Elf1